MSALPPALSSSLPTANELDVYFEERDRRAEVLKCKLGATVGGLWIPGPLYWLRYVMGDQGCQPGVITFDKHSQEKGTSPYPRFPGPDTHPYLPWLFGLFANHRRVFIPKSREMMASWCGVGFCMWTCQFFPASEAIVQTQTEDKVIDLIKGVDAPGYARALYEGQPKWLQNRYKLARPMKEQSQREITWENHSVIRGVPSGADQVRQYHPTLVMFDEAAFLSEFKSSYGSADLVASKIIAVSSAGPGWFADVCSEETA
jgi:hypothetical protein